MAFHRVVPLVTLGLVLMGADAGAIVRRHDRDDKQYLDLAAKYPAVTRLGGGTATLVEPHWLITAAHVAEGLSPFDESVQFAGKSYSIEAIALHPQANHRARRKRVDIALIRLGKPVEGVSPVDMYEKNDENGKVVVFVGPGMFGDGLTGPIGDDRKMRAATNTVSDVTDNYVVFKFDAPPDATDLEGISGPGDSGGPALIEVDSRMIVIGVSSANDDAGAMGPCRYRSTEYYARVSTTMEWIRATMQSDIPPRVALGETVDLQSGDWPETPAGQLAMAFFSAYAQGTDESMETFERTYRAESALMARPVDDRVKSWHTYRDEWGALTTRKCVADGPHNLHVLLRAEKDGTWKSFHFVLEPEAPHKLTGIRIASPIAAE